MEDGYLKTSRCVFCLSAGNNLSYIDVISANDSVAMLKRRRTPVKVY